MEVGFEWRDALHGPALHWHLWVEDGGTEQLFHSELWNLTKAMIREGDIKIAFTIPIMEPPPSQLYLRYPPLLAPPRRTRAPHVVHSTHLDEDRVGRNPIITSPTSA